MFMERFHEWCIRFRKGDRFWEDFKGGFRKSAKSVHITGGALANTHNIMLLCSPSLAFNTLLDV